MSLLYYYERTAPIPYRHGYLSTRISSPSLSRSYDSLPLSHVNLFTLVTHWYGGYTHLLPLVRKVSDIQQVLSLLTMGMRPYCHTAWSKPRHGSRQKKTRTVF
jgi:hypothetical protein